MWYASFGRGTTVRARGENKMRSNQKRRKAVHIALLFNLKGQPERTQKRIAFLSKSHTRILVGAAYIYCKAEAPTAILTRREWYRKPARAHVAVVVYSRVANGIKNAHQTEERRQQVPSFNLIFPFGVWDRREQEFSRPLL